MSNKLKSHSGTKKRFKITATGKIKRSHAGASHIMSKKSPKTLRNLRKSTLVSKGDHKHITEGLAAR